MGYWLKPLKKGAKDYNIGAFSWPVILNDTGACYLLKYGQHTISPGSYIYSNDNNGSPVSNDGYKVTASEAKSMAKIFRGYVFVKSSILEDWEKLSESERYCIKIMDKRAEPPCKQLLKNIEELAEFCEQSGGFIIK